MKAYPSIPKEINTSCQFYVFDKLDGSQIRCEWNKKNGLWKFGTRTRLLDQNEKPFGEAVNLVLNKYNESLSKIFTDLRTEEATCFFEFFGPNSFAGNHAEETHDVVLFDVSLYKKGFVPPKEFVKLFNNIDTPKLLYHGNINKPFIDSVKNSCLFGLTFEGVVCKAKETGNNVTMFKIKSNAWLYRLKQQCGSDETLFNSLS